MDSFTHYWQPSCISQPMRMISQRPPLAIGFSQANSVVLIYAYWYYPSTIIAVYEMAPLSFLQFSGSYHFVSLWCLCLIQSITQVEIGPFKHSVFHLMIVVLRSQSSLGVKWSASSVQTSYNILTCNYVEWVSHFVYVCLCWVRIY